ncbi:PREDICTED: uncharacterized protein LOC109333068 isoform X2 [Lupinus angustifolius]|uniref:uncharacterized protein LOC109333068 isoform X2 n=1 Tax=Lupinus angustifolius TaxID=3871 RepID=UPI00092EC3E9|nr:PREDICTED: uncharacterized protein LOC109333068 isoform X2 [Lupinus angustifolius]
MGSLWFFNLFLKCIDHFAWPLVALGYPLCASIQAIETDSYTETRNLISYWILFSLIYLFEYAFMRLLQWVQFWPYIKLMVIFWLIIPDFGRSSSVYNHLVHSSISLKPQAVISRLKNWKKLFVKKQDFLQHAERYIEENGTEALAKLIASKKEHDMNTIGRRHKTEHKDLEVLEVTEKKTIPVIKQDIPSVPNLAPIQNASSAMVGKDTNSVELPQSSTNKEVQKEWTCAICQVTTTSENNLNSHLHGRKHKDACEALKAKIKLAPHKLKFVEEFKQINISHADVEPENIQILRAKEHAQTSRETEKSILSDGVKLRSTSTQENKRTHVSVLAPANKNHKKVQALSKNPGKPVLVIPPKLRCEVCNVSCTSKGDLESHLTGRRHLAQAEKLT